MKTRSIETLRLMTKERVLMYCEDANREIARLRNTQDRLLKRTRELEAICATFDPKLRDPDTQR